MSRPVAGTVMKTGRDSAWRRWMWRRWAEEVEPHYRATHDERARLARLLTLRDTVFAVVVVLLATVIAAHVSSSQTVRQFVYPGAYFVLVVLGVACVAYYVSATLRSGERQHIQNSPRQALQYMRGVLVFLGVLFILNQLRMLPVHSIWARALGDWLVIVAASAAFVLFRLVLWYVK